MTNNKVIFPVQLAKGKNLGTKDIDLNKIYIWINGPIGLGIKLFNLGHSSIKLRVGDTDLVAYLGDSTTPFRGTNNDSVLVQLMVEVNPLVVGAILTNNLLLIID